MYLPLSREEGTWLMKVHLMKLPPNLFIFYYFFLGGGGLVNFLSCKALILGLPLGKCKSTNRQNKTTKKKDRLQQQQQQQKKTGNKNTSVEMAK